MKKIKNTNNNQYIFEDIVPNVPEIDLEELKNIQRKIENYTSGKSMQGLTVKETEKFLDWVSFNSRSYAVKDVKDSITEATMFGQCAPTQNINKIVLSKLGLKVRAFNIADCIGEIQMNQFDKNRIQNGWNSMAIRHSVLLVEIPIINQDGQTQIYKFLLDPTFRQFCLKENCCINKFIDKNDTEHRQVAPHPGFFMMKENLKWLGQADGISEKAEELCKTIIYKGYFHLNEENAKLYGDAFVRASERLEYQNYPINMTGKDYITNFENIPMKTVGRTSNEQFTKLPSEIGKTKGKIYKLIDFFKNKFNRKTQKMLPSGNTINIPNSMCKENKLENAKLREEELKKFRIAEQEIIENYQNSINENDNKQYAKSL